MSHCLRDFLSASGDLVDASGCDILHLPEKNAANGVQQWHGNKQSSSNRLFNHVETGETLPTCFGPPCKGWKGLMDETVFAENPSAAVIISCSRRRLSCSAMTFVDQKPNHPMTVGSNKVRNVSAGLNPNQARWSHLKWNRFRCVTGEPLQL